MMSLFWSFLFTIAIEFISILPIYLILQIPIGFILQHKRWLTRIVSLVCVLIVILIGEWNHDPLQHIPTLLPAIILLFFIQALFDLIPQKDKSWF